jgi:hypothetical protein
MGEYSLLQDLFINLTATNHYTLIGVTFPGTTSGTASMAFCTINVTNSTASNGGTSTVTGILCNGTRILNNISTTFNCLTNSKINVFSNGNGNKRGILITNTNVVVARATNIYVAQPPFTGVSPTYTAASYVGVETADAANIGSIQLRTCSIQTVTPMVGQTYTASDILQTFPTSLTNPSYLASPGIQIGPGTDLLTKTAGGKPFSTFIYPTTVFYGLKGDIKTIGNHPGYLWPGTQEIKTNVFPDPGTVVPAYYRVQQPCIISGMSCGLNIAPGTGHTVTVIVRYTPTITPVVIDTIFTVTFGATDLVKNFYNGSLDLNTGDRIHVYVSYTGGNGNTAHDLTVQLDMF